MRIKMTSASMNCGELGSDLIDRLVVEPVSYNVISRLTILEMESVLALKAQTGEIDHESVLIARRRLEADLGSRSLWSQPLTTSTSVAPANYLWIMA